MNEAGSRPVRLDRLVFGRVRRGDPIQTGAEANFPLNWRIGFTRAASLACALASMTGCVTAGGESSRGPSSQAGIQGAMSTRNIVLQEQVVAQQQAAVTALAARQQRQSEAAQARAAVAAAAGQLEQQRQMADRQRDREVQRQQAQQQAQQQPQQQGQGDQGNRGRHLGQLK